MLFKIMFQSLRAGSTVYVLSKNGVPSLAKATVIAVTLPRPKYQVPPVFGTPTDMTIDLTVKVGNQETIYPELPASAEISDVKNTALVVSTNREAMNAEVLSVKEKSEEAINSLDTHRQIIVECDKILESLNPEYAEKQKQQGRIDELEAKMAELLEMNKTLMAKLDPGA